MKKIIQISDIYEKTQSQYVLGVRQNRLYIQEEGHWFPIGENELAIKIRAMYSPQERLLISSSAIKEVAERMLQDPEIQLHFVEETAEKYIRLRGSVFDVEEGKLVHNVQGEFGYFLDCNYIEDPDKRVMNNFNTFLESAFPEEYESKRKLLLEILGYVFSDYQKAKAAFFLIGETNSGKSTILEFVQRLLPRECVTSIPLYRLESRFNLARLANSRLNVCTELSEKSFASSDIFKMLTSNEVVTAEHKGCKPFEFRLRCKSLNAGNLIPDIKNVEGMRAIINRMVILLFPVSIPKERQDLELLEKLYRERDSIISEALDMLVDLRKRNFCFTEPLDSKKLKTQLLERGDVLEKFLSECCIQEPKAQIYLVDLFEAFQKYCEENLVDCSITKMQFSQYLSRKPYIERKKMRITGGRPLSGLNGIRLKKEAEYVPQDSQLYSQKHQENTEGRNSGTLEQGGGNYGKKIFAKSYRS